jgi:hypothetical protein
MFMVTLYLLQAFQHVPEPYEANKRLSRFGRHFDALDKALKEHQDCCATAGDVWLAQMRLPLDCQKLAHLPKHSLQLRFTGIVIL